MVEVTGSNPVSPTNPDRSCRGFMLYGSGPLSIMFKNITWLALTNIRRKKTGSVLFFIIAFFISHSLFLIRLSNVYLSLPSFEDIRSFFYAVTISALILCILLLCGLAFLFIKTRSREMGIMRMYGARISDLLFLNTLEVFIISFAGGFFGIFTIILLISARALYIPYFFKNMELPAVLKLIGLGGQTLFLVVIVEVAVSLVLLVFLLLKDIRDLARG